MLVDFVLTPLGVMYLSVAGKERKEEEKEEEERERESQRFWFRLFRLSVTTTFFPRLPRCACVCFVF